MAIHISLDFSRLDPYIISEAYKNGLIIIMLYFKRNAELALAVVTAATVFVSVVCSHWAIALGVVIMFDLANLCKRYLEEKSLCKRHKPKNDGAGLDEGG